MKEVNEFTDPDELLGYMSEALDRLSAIGNMRHVLDHQVDLTHTLLKIDHAQSKATYINDVKKLENQFNLPDYQKGEK